MYALFIEDSDGDIVVDHVAQRADTPVVIPDFIRTAYDMPPGPVASGYLIAWAKQNKPQWTIRYRECATKHLFTLP